MLQLVINPHKEHPLAKGGMVRWGNQYSIQDL